MKKLKALEILRRELQNNYEKKNSRLYDIAIQKGEAENGQQ